jgi:hypothetical protein
LQVNEAASGASFRDPAGYVFDDAGIIKRVVTNYGAADYRQFMSSGLYDALLQDGLLVPHEEIPVPSRSDAAAILIPEKIPYISYPYEWSFGQFRDAALLTLRIQRLAMQHGMSLKDASAFNIQFRGSQPVFIDTLSFEPNDGGPWVAYNQFCRHFLASLLLMGHVSPGFNKFWKASLDGFPLDLTSSLLPKTTYMSFGALLHIHLHARTQKKYEASSGVPLKVVLKSGAPDRKAALVDSLRAFIGSLRLGQLQTEWLHYYDQKTAHYSTAAEESKKKSVQYALDYVNPKVVYDLGGNIGEYSRLAAVRGSYTVCFDIDPLCVHQNYERARSEKDIRMLPLMLDLTNPSGNFGFGLRERKSIVDRGKADMVMALALIHHLRITGNTPLKLIAQFLAQMGEFILLEYVPKSDIMAQALLRSRKDTFLDYSDDGFRSAFESCFDVVQTLPVAETERSLFLFKRR